MTNNTYHLSVNNSNIAEINSGGEIYELITSNGFQLKTYEHIPNVLSFTSSDSIRKEIFDKSYIKYKTDEIFFNLNSVVLKFKKKYSWGLDRIGKRNPLLQKKYFGTETGKGVNLFAIDSGVFHQHDSVNKKINLTFAYDAFFDNNDVNFILPFNNNSYIDSHGTEMASIILDGDFGTTSNVNYIPVRIFNDIGIASLSDLLDSCNHIIDTHLSINVSTPFGNSLYKPSIVNMPFSTKNKALLLDDVMSALLANNIHVVTSSGNDNDDAYNYSPQSAGVSRNKVLISGNTYRVDTSINYTKKPIVVGGCDNPSIEIIQKDKVWKEDNFNGSNWGEFVDILCPAKDILVGSLSFSGSNWNNSIRNYYTYKSGTSYSSAFCCGILAMYLQKEKNLTTTQLYNKLLRRSTIGSLEIDDLSNLRDNEQNDIFINPVVVTPNRIGYIWYTPILINFDTINTIIVDENTENDIKITAISTDSFNEKQKVSFFLGTVTSPIPTYTDLNITALFGDIYEGNDIFGNLNIQSNFVTEDTVSTITITVVDGFSDDYRHFQTLSIPINIKNLSVMPTWLLPVESNLGDISQDDNIDIVFSCRDLTDGSPVTYTILPSNEVLPIGLRFQNLVDGTFKIFGTVGALDKKLEKYEFFIRAKTSVGKFSDKYFFWNTNIVNIPQEFDTLWTDTLPSTTVNTNVYYNLGTYPKNTPLGINLLINLLIYNPDNDPLIIKLFKSPDITTSFGKLPLGLKLNTESRRIEGIPSVSISGGTYYFKITLGDGEFVTNGYFSITISNDDIGLIQDPSDITWTTPAGFIGEIYETYPSHLSVLAKNSANGRIQYILSSASNPMPQGLSIDANTGYIVGNAPYVSGTATYSITVSAYNEFVSVDRTFTFTIISIYDTQNVISIDVLLTGLPTKDRLNLVRLQSFINKNNIFREDDENFGIKQDLRMYLVAGLNSVSDSVVYAKLKDYHQDLSVKFGKLNYQSVTDTVGNNLYDVIYYEILDTSSGAAGFDVQNIEVPLPYAQGLIKGQFPYKTSSTTTQDNFFSKSLNNFRKDLINIENRYIRKDEVTLNTSPNDEQNGIGVSGNEGYPLWMISKNRNSIDKFVSAIPIAFVSYGTAFDVVKTLQVNKLDTVLTGLSLMIDRYLVQRFIISNTSFDDTLIYQYSKTALITSYQEVADITERNNIVSPLLGNVVKVINTNEYYIWNSTIDVQPNGWLDITTFGSFDISNIGDTIIINNLTTDGNETIFDFDSITNTKTDFDLAIIKEKRFIKFPPSDEKR